MSTQGGYFGNSAMVTQHELANPNCSVLVHFQSDLGLVDIVPKIPSFGSFSHISGIHGALTNIEDSMEHCENSPYGNRKRKVTLGASTKNAEEEQQKAEKSDFAKEDDEKKQKFELSIHPNCRSKQAIKQSKDNSIGLEPLKENYIHARAKRGQATNSHSLAERVRRERISERMRLLQELVPGCNKITGKAMMLDEIINYVQSLQQQVEFLSMKLATVNPELNVDIDRILSKDILHLGSSDATAHGISPGLSSFNPFHGYPHGTFNNGPGTTPFNPLSQHIWNSELQSNFQMGFDPHH